MAVETEGLSSPVYSAEFVGNNFVEQYFKVLQMDPDLIYKFYEESSTLSWPDPEGVMSAVTTTQAIKDKISSLDYKGCKAEITTIDSQYSQNEGVMVLVAGCLTTRDSVKRNFVQAFFLARHAKGYYVLNDIFRFVDVFEASTLSAVIDANENLPPAPLTPDQVSNHIPTHPSSTNAVSKGSKVRDSSDMNNSSDSNDLVGKEAVVSGKLTLNRSNGPIVIESASNVQKDSQKMSYASVVVKESTTPSVLLSTHNVVTVAPSSTHQEKQAPPAPRKPSAAFCTNSGPRNTTTHTEGGGVYIGNLPFEVTVEQLDDIFKKFGPIEREGIQIRNCKDGFSYGFVKFESSDSARSAIEAHNIKVGSNEVYIREKRYFNQGNDRGRLSSGKSELRNANFRGRENSVEGRNYRPYQHGSRGEASHKARSPARENRWSFGEASPGRIQSLEEQSNHEGVGCSSGAKGRENTRKSSIAGIESPYKTPELVEKQAKERGWLNSMEDMPCVFTQGDGPNGRRIEGILHKDGKGEEVRIMCTCHGSFLSPAKFVKYAGGGDVAHLLKRIVVNSSSASFM